MLLHQLVGEGVQVVLGRIQGQGDAVGLEAPTDEASADEAPADETPAEELATPEKEASAQAE